MAINRGNSISGLMGPVVLYQLNGVNIMRSRPRKHKKSKASQQAAKDFGAASRLSALLRRGIYRLVEHISQTGTRYRFDRVIREWYRHYKNSSGEQAHSFLEQFQFNEKISLAERLKIRAEVDWSKPGKILIKIPSLIPQLDIAAPKNTDSVKWKIAISTASPEYPYHGGSWSEEFAMKYSSDRIGEQTLEMDSSLKDGDLGMIVLALKYSLLSTGDLLDENWLPVGVIGSYYKDKSVVDSRK